MVENEERRYDEGNRDDVRGDLVPAALYINLGRGTRVGEIDKYLSDVCDIIAVVTVWSGDFALRIRKRNLREELWAGRWRFQLGHRNSLSIDRIMPYYGPSLAADRNSKLKCFDRNHPTSINLMGPNCKSYLTNFTER